VRLTTLDNLVKGESGAFTIAKAAGLTLAAPENDEVLIAVEPYTIRWSPDPDVMELKLEFSRDNGSTFTTIADHAPNTGSYDWLVPINFTRNGIIRVSDASGRPWSEEGLLEFSLKFIYSGESDEPGAVLWFGSTDPKSPSFEFGRIAISGNAMEFGGLSKTIEPLAGGWHELRMRLDFRRDTAELRLDELMLFENAPLGTTREHYFQPNLALQAGGDNGVEFMMDDLAINVVQPDSTGGEELSFNALSEDFDRYDERNNALARCWRLAGASDKRNGAQLQGEGAQNRSLRLTSEPGRKLMIWLPFSLPDKIPFDISDKRFTIGN
jgi:hypothetical protein